MAAVARTCGLEAGNGGPEAQERPGTRPKGAEDQGEDTGVYAMVIGRARKV